MEIASLEVRISASMDAATASISRLENQLGSLDSTLRRTLNSVPQSSFNGLNNFSRSVSAGLNNATRGLSSFKSNSKIAVKSIHSITSSFAKLYIGIKTVTKSFSMLGNSIEQACDSIEVLNYFNAAFGQVAESAVDQWEKAGYDSAESYYNSFSQRAQQLTTKMTGFTISDSGMLEATGGKSLGINPKDLMNYQAMFAQMSNSMGVTAETSLKLSTALTEIGADLASVRNMKFDKVWTDMASGLAGMSRTLDKYGANIRNVNLQQKLNEIGIKASITALNQNEKALLRTIILLDSTRYAWGDLAETINSPANQLRLLEANFNNLARTIGNIFLPIVAKVLPYINALVSALQRLAQFIVKLLGFEGFDWGGASGTGGGFDELIGGAEDLEEGLDGASGAAKKLNKQIRAFDELNVITMPEETTGAGGGLGGGIDTGLLEGALDDILDEYQTVWDKAFDEMEERANQFADNVAKAFQTGGLFGVGRYLSERLTEALNSIPWESIYEGARTFGTGLAEFLNGLITPDLFAAVGQTIAGALNTAIYAALSFAEDFNWQNFGASLAAGVNKFFETFDFIALADGINAWANGLLDALIEFLDDVEWELVGTKIGEFLAELDFVSVGEKVAEALWKAIKAAWTTWKASFDAAPLETTVLSAILLLKWTGLGGAIWTSVSNAIVTALGADKGTKIGVALFNWIKNGVASIATKIALTVEGLFNGLSFSEALAGGFGGSASTISTIGTALAGIATTIGGVITAVVNFVTMLKEGFSWLNEILMVVGTGLAAVGAVILGAPALVAGIVAAVVAAVATIVVVVHDNWNAICEWFSGIADWINQNVIQPVVNFFKGVWDSVSGFFSGLWNDIVGIWNAASSWFNSTVIEPIVSFFQGLWTRVQQIFEGLWLIIQAVWIIASTWFNENVITPIVTFFQELWTKVSGFFSQLWEDICEIWTTVSTWFNDNVITPVTDFFRGVWENVSGFFSELWEDIKTVWNVVSGWFNTKIITPVKNAFKTACDAIGGFFSSLWDGIKGGVKSAMNGVIGAIEGAINFMVSGINGLLDGFNSAAAWAANVVGTDWGGVTLLPTVSLPRLAKGGLITGDTIIEAGERGREAVIPLTNSIAMKDIANAISVPLAKSFQSIGVNNYVAAKPPTLPYQNYASIRNQAEMQSSNYEYSQGYSSGTESIIYNATYRAISSALSNNKYFRDLCDDVAAGHTIEIDGQPMANVVKKKFNEEFKRTGRPAIEF